MKDRNMNWLGVRSGFARDGLAGVLLAVFGIPVLASPPIDPLPVPLYSFDADSPSIGSNGLFPDAVFRKVVGAQNSLVVEVEGQGLDLGLPGDEMDGLSFNRAGEFPDGTPFMLLFSVGRATTGDVPPDPAMLDAETPFNVADQALRGHAAGDGFVSLNLFDRNGPVVSLRGTTAASNVQAFNNYDEGGHDFEAQPATSSRDIVSASQDNVDSMAAEPVSTNSLRSTDITGVYFTVSAESTSLISGMLPGNSGADVFFHPAPGVPGAEARLYASAIDLGLAAMPPMDNEMAGLTIFDNNTNGAYDAGDMVLFTLTPNSPALLQIPNVGANPAANIYAAHIDAGGVHHLRVFAHASDLGLAGPQDHIDALEVVPCSTDPATCASGMGIRLERGDWNNDAAVDAEDILPLVTCLSGPREGMGFAEPPRLCRDVFDFDYDRDVDEADFQRFQLVFGEGGASLPPS